jgi:hypothetical protein
MIDRKAFVTLICLIGGTFIVSLWSFLHVYETHPEAMSAVWLIFGHLLGPAWGVITWRLMLREVRNFPNPQNLERPLRQHYGFVLIACCALVALHQVTFAARDFGLTIPFRDFRHLGIVLLGLILIVAGNAKGKLPSPYKGGHSEPVSWDKMSRFQGWVFVAMGFALIAAAFIVPDRGMLPTLAALWAIGMLLLLAKRQRLKQDKQREDGAP